MQTLDETQNSRFRFRSFGKIGAPVLRYCNINVSSLVRSASEEIELHGTAIFQILDTSRQLVAPDLSVAYDIAVSGQGLSDSRFLFKLNELGAMRRCPDRFGAEFFGANLWDYESVLGRSMKETLRARIWLRSYCQTLASIMVKALNARYPLKTRPGPTRFRPSHEH